jgi:predicted RNA methylase
MIVDEYVPIPRAAAIEMLKEAGLKENDTLYMLGCGDGELPILAAKEFKARCVGIERKERLANEARERVKKEGLEDRVTIIYDNFHFPQFWAHIEDGKEKPYAIRNADVVVYYLTLQVQELLRDKLIKELKPGARVASYAFKLMGWEPVKTKMVEGVPIYIFEKGKSF